MFVSNKVKKLRLLIFLFNNNALFHMAQSAGSAEFTDCISAEG